MGASSPDAQGFLNNRLSKFYRRSIRRRQRVSLCHRSQAHLARGVQSFNVAQWRSSGAQAVAQLLNGLQALPTLLGQLNADARTLKLLYEALQAPGVVHDSNDLARLVMPLLVAAQRCAGRRTVTMRLPYLLVRDISPSRRHGVAPAVAPALVR